MPPPTYPFLPVVPKAFINAVPEYRPFTPPNREYPQQNNGIGYRKDTFDKIDSRHLYPLTIPISANSSAETPGKPLFCWWGNAVPRATEDI